MENSISEEFAFILNKVASTYLAVCAGFGWNRAIFFHRGWYGYVCWICSEHSAENRGIFGILSLLLGSARPEPRPFLHLTPTHQQGGLGYTELVGDTAETNDPK